MKLPAKLVPLEPGESIGVVALSGPVERAKLAAGLEVLRSWGHPLVLAPNLTAREPYLAGNDEERLAGLEAVLAGGARVVIAARGGYGVTRLLERLPWQRLVDWKATLVGYSDVTALLNPLASRSGVAQVHGPMVAAGLARPHNARRLRRVLNGELAGEVLLRFPASAVVRAGRAEGHLVGGTLAMMTSLLGTPYEPAWDGAVLILEEVGEPVYRLDRMLTQLATSGRLAGVRALLGGGLRGCSPPAACRARWRELLAEITGSRVPVVVGLPFGHVARNLALPLGCRVAVDTAAGTVRWVE